MASALISRPWSSAVHAVAQRSDEPDVGDHDRDGDVGDIFGDAADPEVELVDQVHRVHPEEAEDRKVEGEVDQVERTQPAIRDHAGEVGEGLEGVTVVATARMRLAEPAD